MSMSSILDTDRSVELKSVAPTSKGAQKGFPPPPASRPVAGARVKSRGPIIAGGIIRMAIGGTRSDEC
jgi:hypothetical protein